MPGLAAGMINLAANQAPGFFVTCSKTLNYDQQQRERFRAHHRRNRKLLGRRVHAGLMVDGHGVVEPFVGTDLQLNESAVLQSDWIAGPGNALSLGMAYVLPDQKTVLNPAMLYSNNTRRIDGFALNISRQVAW